jgi:hypothetical protein
MDRYSEIINSFAFSRNGDLQAIRDSLLSFADKNYQDSYVRHAINAEYIARFFVDDCLISEINKRLPKKVIIEIFKWIWPTNYIRSKYIMKEYTTDTAWDYLLENEIVSEETLKVVTSINGYNIETLQDVLYATTGYRSFEQLEGEQ